MLQRLSNFGRKAIVMAANNNGSLAVRCMSSGHGFKPDTQVVAEARSSLSDLPVPQGSWKEHYDKKNAKWNMSLGGTIIFFALTMVACYKGNVFLYHTVPNYKKVKVNV